MKLQIIAFVFCSLLVSSLSAQFSIGAKGGVSFSNVRLDKNLDAVFPDTDMAIGKTFSVVMAFDVTDRFSIQPELSYTEKGFETSLGTEYELFNIPLPLGATAETSVKFIEIPVLGKYKFGDGPVSGYALAGPTIAYAAAGEIKTKATLVIDFNLFKQDINLSNSNFNRMELGGLVGAGVNFDLGSTSLFLDARYKMGFSNFFNDPLVDVTLQTRNLGINAGFLIPL